jgi:serine/threonine protein kinase
MDESNRIKHLIDQLTRSYTYSKSTHVLFRQLSTFITTIVQDEACLKKKPHETRLHDILCEFSMAYVPVPMGQQLYEHGKLVNKKPLVGTGSNGNVYKSGVFDGNPIVTKTKKRWSNHTIYDIFINFVIINSFLLRNEFIYNLIPSYGLFLCTTNEDGTEICVHPSKQEHLFLVQKEIKGFTLSHHIRTLSLQRFTQIIKEVSLVLLELESSPYQLYHMDLHLNNIILVRGEDRIEHPVLLDFELSSFTVKDEEGQPHRYCLNSVENTYCDGDHLLSGVYDFVLFFSHASVFNNPAIQDYCKTQLAILFDGLWQDVNVPFQITPDTFIHSNQRWLYNLLHQTEESLSVENRMIVHTHNMEVLRNKTYRSVINQLGLLL